MAISIAFVGNPREWANSLSKATEIIARYIIVVNTICNILIMASVAMSLSVMVSILPKRYVVSSAEYPGVIKQNITPIVIPNTHSIAIAESSLISLCLPNCCIPMADAAAKINAPIVGLKEKYIPIPTPPNDACVIPPLINSRRRVTMYVPMMPHEIHASSVPMSAFLKNIYSNNSISSVVLHEAIAE